MALSWRPLTTYQITGHIVARALMVHCRIPSHLLKRFFPKTFAPFKTKNFQLKDEFLMNFFFFSLNRQAMESMAEARGTDAMLLR